MRVAIFGAGALGTILGAYISKNTPGSGLDLGDGIELYNRNVAHVKALREHGAIVDGEVSFTQKVKAFTPDELEGMFDYVFLMTKQLNNSQTIDLLKDHIKPEGAIVTTQNGLPEPAIAEVMGEDRVLGCTIGWGATLRVPGTSTLTSSKDRLVCDLGAISEGGKRHIPVVKAILELMGPVTVRENFIGARWTKLLINSAFSGMSIVIGDTFGAVCDNMKARRCAQAIMKEVIEVSKAAGVTLEPMQGNNVAKLFDYNGWFRKAVGLIVIPIGMRRHRGILSGMYVDYRNGKPCEIDQINGCVCQAGKKYGVPTPFNDKVVELVHGYEKGEGKPSYDSLNAFDCLLK